MTCGATTCSRPHAADPASAEAPSLRAALRRIAIWRARARQRRALAMLDDTRLRDIGLTREQAEAEAAKPFWEG